jgi:hypothetical protein
MSKPKINKADVQLLQRALVDGKWHKSKTIPLLHRKIRLICEKYPNKVMSGQQGYKLTRFATKEEIQHAVRDLLSRCAHMSRRAKVLAELIGGDY